jgi:hypothetical protein
MNRTKTKSPSAFTDRIMGEASWLLSHAQALAAYGRQEEATAEWARAAACAEQAACLLEADGEGREAAIHRASAASCYEKIGQAVRAVTLLRAALSADLSDDFRGRVEQHLARCLAQAKKQLRRAFPRGARRPASRIP